ncbi:MAG TPA: hypothetical protein VF820_04535 [Patescibacteria group bacterium]
MRISVLHEKRDILIQTVSVTPNTDEPDNLYLFRCPYCSSSTGAQVQGKITKISEGLTPTEDVVTIHQCKGCKRLYTFQTVKYLPKKYTQVTLISIPGVIGIFSCWLCRNPLLQFKDGRIIRLPNFELLTVPFTMDCVNPTCPAKYKIVDYV